MADDLSLLFKIRGDASGAKQATAETRAAVAQLRTQTITDSRAIQQSTTTAAKGPQALAMSLQTVQTALQGVGGPLGRMAPQLDNASSLMGALSSQTLTTSGSIAAIAGPVGIAVAAFAALTTGVTVLVHQFAALVVSTAQWEGKLYDLSQQTGVSVETLSTLSALAEDTGGSIEGIAQSLVIFQGQLEEAQDSSTKAGKTFAELGISTNDTEQAFREALKALAAMDEGFRQTNNAAELFGKRGGKQVLAILKESNGDIDATTEKLRALNSLVTGPIAKGADQFNDQLNATRRQFQGLTAQIVNESMPLIVRALQDLSKILRENRELFILLGQAVGLFIQGNLRILAPALEIASRVFEGHRRALLPVIEAYERLAAAIQLVTNSVPNVDPNAIPAVGAPPVVSFGGSATLDKGIFRKKGTGSGKGGGGPKDTALQDATAEAELAERELRQKIEADVAENKRALDEQARDIEAYTVRAIELAEQRHDAVIVRINKEIAALDAAFAKKLILEKDYNRRNRELDIENEEAKRAKDDAVWEAETKRDRDKAAAEFAAHERSVQMADEASDRLIRIIQDRVDRQIIFETEGETQIAELIAQGFARRKALLEDELTRLTTSLERKREINDELIRLDGERADAAVRAAQRIREAREGELPQRPRRIKDATRPRSVEEEEFGKPLLIEENKSAIDQLFGAIETHLGGATQTAALAGLEALTGAFQGLGQAIGSVVEAWVLYGSAGTSVRKVTAQILAGIAQQAAVKAIFELAEGFAALALAFFGMPNAGPSASAHFTAAAIYGSIAAVAAVAGRAVAGDAFKQQASGGSGGGSSRAGGSSGGSSGSAQSAKPGTTDVNRNALPHPVIIQPLVKVTVEGQATEGFRYMVTRAVVEDYRSGGDINEMLGHSQGKLGFKG